MDGYFLLPEWLQKYADIEHIPTSGYLTIVNVIHIVGCLEFKFVGKVNGFVVAMAGEIFSRFFLHFSILDIDSISHSGMKEANCSLLQRKRWEL